MLSYQFQIYLLWNETFVHDVFTVGPSSMPCQLMVGFFAYAKSLDINVDKEELEGTSHIIASFCMLFSFGEEQWLTWWGAMCYTRYYEHYIMLLIPYWSVCTCELLIPASNITWHATNRLQLYWIKKWQVILVHDNLKLWETIVEFYFFSSQPYYMIVLFLIW